ncbi:hypothetical protein CYMTET_3567 [Cymbomonas tetramitiformis]|uniref:Uncharacterized protein n=1 Tax=Cymbomonas tetramitiformis TaxID=36881 RepID=A0AAE0H3D3_9CHLO|nr:hypothetical protein CYMTET_3567 [Cymbomonas tetramitiformis]
MVEPCDGFDFTSPDLCKNRLCYATCAATRGTHDHPTFLGKGTLCMFEGQVLTPIGTSSTMGYYAENSMNTLPPLHFQASAALEDLQRWKIARWNADLSVYEQ